MKYIFFVTFNICMLFSTAYTGSITQKTSTCGKQKPDFNCSGMLIIKSGGQYNNIENITIAGLYKQIRVYPKPSNTQQDPKKHRAYLDLAELAQIRVLNTTFYDKQPFTELEVTRKGGTKDNYLIESNRVVRYDIPIASSYEEREINIEAINILTFYNCKKQMEEDKNNKKDKCKE